MDGRRALAKAFDDWYSSSGLNQGQVAAAGGPSTTTQTKVRQDDGPISRQTLNQLDYVTGWPAGTAARILGGQQQAPADGLGAIDWSRVTNEELAEQVRVRLVSTHARELTVRKGSRQHR